MVFFDAAYAAAERPVRLRDADPDLLGDAGARHPLADRPLELVRLDTGCWTDPHRWGEPALGLLIVDGLLVRRVALGRHRRAELLGAGDVVRPWEGEEPFGTLALSLEWHVLAPARLAVMDAAFVRAAAGAPDVLGRIAVRSVRRSQRLALQLAIGDVRSIVQRLLAFFLHLGDRWGRMTPDGVHLPVRMTHELIAELVGAKRPTVTTALGALERSGAVERLDDRSWLVRAPAGDPVVAATERGTPLGTS